MNIIVAVDENWGIGRDGGLLVRNPIDMKFFRTTTTGNVVIMGRKTLDSFPGGKPLKNRINIVLSTNPDFEREGVIVAHNIQEALDNSRQYDSENVYVAGGGKIYEQMLPYCDRAYVTHLYDSFNADTYFPALTEENGWKLVSQGEVQDYEGLKFAFCTYEHIR